MHIESLTFKDFRSYSQLDLDDLGNLTIFVGKNAVGKTNILEGIQLLTSASSFRHPQITQLICEGCDRARISMNATDGNRCLTTALMLEAGKRRYLVNGKVKNAVDVRGILPSVMFTPDDLELAKKSSSVKRAALDDLGVQLTRNYYIVRRDYEKTLRYKNRLLKDDAALPLLQSINDTLVTCGTQLYCYRRALFGRIVPHIARAYEQLASDGEKFEAGYLPSWERVKKRDSETTGKGLFPHPSHGGEKESLSRDDVRDIMTRHLAYHLEEERFRRRSLIGPHNDEITFLLDGRDVTTFASQGQQRSIVLAWKLAEVEITREVLGMSPVLLLDDVLSELDESRREMLVRFVTDDIQTFITATDLAGFHESLVTRARVVDLPL